MDAVSKVRALVAKIVAILRADGAQREVPCVALAGRHRFAPHPTFLSSPCGGGEDLATSFLEAAREEKLKKSAGTGESEPILPSPHPAPLLHTLAGEWGAGGHLLLCLGLRT